MKANYFSKSAGRFTAAFFLVFSIGCNAQSDNPYDGDFWDHVQFGGGIGASFGSDYTDVSLAPGAIYNFNEFVALGIGLNGTYVDAKDYYSSYIYGGSLIALFSPFEQIQLSTELEQLRVNNTYDLVGGDTLKDNFWNTALYLGAGFRSGNVTLGVRYNVLFKKNENVYSEPFMPFVRFYF